MTEYLGPPYLYLLISLPHARIAATDTYTPSSSLGYCHPVGVLFEHGVYLEHAPGRSGVPEISQPPTPSQICTPTALSHRLPPLNNLFSLPVISANPSSHASDPQPNSQPSNFYHPYP